MIDHRLTVADVRAAGYCLKGVRIVCAARGLDFRAFVREGLPLTDMEEIDDAQFKRACREARKRIDG